MTGNTPQFCWAAYRDCGPVMTAGGMRRHWALVQQYHNMPDNWGFVQRQIGLSRKDHDTDHYVGFGGHRQWIVMILRGVAPTDRYEVPIWR